MVFINPNVTHNTELKMSIYPLNTVVIVTRQASLHSSSIEEKRYHLIHFLKQPFVCQMAMSEIKILETNEWNLIEFNKRFFSMKHLFAFC